MKPSCRYFPLMASFNSLWGRRDRVARLDLVPPALPPPPPCGWREAPDKRGRSTLRAQGGGRVGSFPFPRSHFPDTCPHLLLSVSDVHWSPHGAIEGQLPLPEDAGRGRLVA